jgi:hypothetical protein
MRRILQEPRGRTIIGLVVGLLFVPVMLGISACLETPIGDPEKGWVDPRITGAWLAGDPAPEDFSAQLWLFEPYDSRTWLVTWVGYGEPDDEDPEEPAADVAGTATDGESTTPGPIGAEAVTAGVAEPAAEEAQETPAALLAPSDVLRILGSLADERVEPQGQYVFKGWITSIAERRFLVLEPKMSVGSERAFRPEAWLVYRIALKEGRMELAMVTGNMDDLQSVTSRGEAEQAIARHVADPDLYDETYPVYRIPEASYDEVAELLRRAGFETW